MLLSRYLVRNGLYTNLLLTKVKRIHFSKFSGLTSLRYGCDCRKFKINQVSWNPIISRLFYSSNTLNSDVPNTWNTTESKRILQLFPNAKQTLNEVASKTSEKVFDIYHKQLVSLPKGNRKRIPNGEWVCSYVFRWPQKIKFESTALSKRVASENAAIQALHWLHANNFIDDKANPIYDQRVINKLQNTINEQIKADISENSMKRIERIWEDYEKEIKPLFEETFKEAANKSFEESPIIKDSRIDEEDEFSDSEVDTDVANVISEGLSHVHPLYGKNVKPPTDRVLQKRNSILKQKFLEYDQELTPLPIDEYADQLISTLENNRVLVLVGAAGCGKSTRAPAAILRKCGANTAAIVSEPRRVAAIGLAQRVASELGEEVGESIGYQVRLQSMPPKPPCGLVLYCTSGILLRRLRTNPGLDGCSHVIIDEAHERDVNTDVTILLLKRALDVNPQLKVLIMSATLDVGVFTRYFDSCPMIEVPGRTFPVTVTHLEDIQRKYRLDLKNSLKNSDQDKWRPVVHCPEVVEVIKAVNSNEPDGAILVFLPGWSEIKYTKQLLDEHYGGESGTHMVIPVHSRLSTQDQIKMFSKPPPGIRKIVLSTTIAETSITIPDVVHVIDTGVYNEHRTREGTGTTSLEKVWVSHSSAKQRAGRAGRVQPGHCYRLYTKEKESTFEAHGTPEILRVPLEQTVLDCKTYAPDNKIADFLSQLPEPPSRRAIEFAVNDLIDIGALTPSEDMTRLGTLLSIFPMKPRLAYSLLVSSIVGNVLSVSNLIAHCANDIQVSNDILDASGFRDLKRGYSETCDYSAMYWLQNAFDDILSGSEVDRFCDRHRLRKDRLRYVKSLTTLYLSQLLKSGFLEPDPEPTELTRFSGVDELTSAVLMAGSNSLLVSRRRVKTKGKLATVTEVFSSSGDRAHIGSESVNYALAKRTTATHLLAYHSGRHSNERRALVVYNTSIVSPLAALLFCKGDVYSDAVSSNDNDTTVLAVPRHKLSVCVPTSQASVILNLREMLWSTLQYYVDRDLSRTEYDLFCKVARFKVRLVKATGRVLVEARGNGDRDGADDE